MGETGRKLKEEEVLEKEKEKGKIEDEPDKEIYSLANLNTCAGQIVMFGEAAATELNTKRGILETSCALRNLMYLLCIYSRVSQFKVICLEIQH